MTWDGVHEAPGVHSALLPHEVFHSLFQHRELFDYLMVGDAGDLEAFWNHASSSEWFKAHPVLELQTSPTNCIPLGFYGDDAGVFNNEKVLMLLWGGVIKNHETLFSRIVFTAVQYSRVVPEKTLDEIYEVFVWSMTWLAIGEFPPVDHKGRAFDDDYYPDRARLAGQRLAGSFVGVVSEMRGDWKYLAEALKLQSHYNKQSCCHLCKAHKTISRLMYTQFDRTCRLRNTLVTMQRFLLNQIGHGAI